MKKLFVLIALIVSFAITSCDSLDTNELLNDDLSLKSGQKVMSFKAHLTGDQEVPAVDTKATGQVVFKLSKDGSMLSYKLIVANIDSVLASHIHLGAPGVNKPPKITLYSSALIEGTSNGILVQGEVSTNQELLDAMKAGNAYVNVHTTTYRSGEIRGQISAN